MMTTNQVVTIEGKEIIEVGTSLSVALVADWLAFNADKTETTRKTYCLALENFFKWLAQNKITSPRREHVISYRNELCESKKVSTERLY